MNEIIERIVSTDELGLAAGWKLIHWCSENGGNEFSFRAMRLGEETSVLHHQMETALESFYLGTRQREPLISLSGQKKKRAISTWKLGRETIGILQREVPEGFFAKPAYSEAGWFEDFTIFRHGEIMMGVVSHEGYAVLRLAGKEHDEIPGLKPSDKKQ